MNILITGGAGFIGSQLGFYLEDKGHEVILLDNLRYGHVDNLIRDDKIHTNFICMDVRDSRLEDVAKGVDVIFHLGGISSLPECNYWAGEAYSCNIGGTANVLEVARRNNIKKVIFSSTSAVYENEKIFPSTEDLIVQPTLVYSLSKKHCEDLCRSFTEMYGMDITILRFFNVYGPHMDYLRPNPPLVSYIIKCLLNAEPPLLHSDGKQARDMIYINDVLSMLEKVMVNPKSRNEIFNVGSGVTTTVQEVYDLVAQAFKKKNIKPVYRKATKIWEKYPGLFMGKYPLKDAILESEVNKYTLSSIEKAKKKLGWEPKIAIKEGLTKTVDYAIKHQKKLK